jgi:hypothetical protein
LRLDGLVGTVMLAQRHEDSLVRAQVGELPPAGVCCRRCLGLDCAPGSNRGPIRNALAENEGGLIACSRHGASRRRRRRRAGGGARGRTGQTCHRAAGGQDGHRGSECEALATTRRNLLARVHELVVEAPADARCAAAGIVAIAEAAGLTAADPDLSHPAPMLHFRSGRARGMALWMRAAASSARRER